MLHPLRLNLKEKEYYSNLINLINNWEKPFTASPLRPHVGQPGYNGVCVTHPDGFKKVYSLLYLCSKTDEEKLKEIYEDWNIDNTPECECVAHSHESECKLTQDNCPVIKVLPQCICGDQFLKEKLPK